MACSPCHLEGYLNEPSIGQCSVSTCGKQVCGPPPHRADGKVHGEHCSCLNGCGKLFCRSHAKGHLKAHGGSDPGCFPNLALTTSGPVVVSALLALALARLERSPGPGEDADQRFKMFAYDQQLASLIGDFLTDITPGVETLVAASLSEKRVEPLWIIHPAIMRGPLSVEGPRIAPGVGFFTESRLERLACLALTEFGDAWRVLRDRHEDAGYTRDPDVISAWDHCAIWARGARPASPTVATITSWVNPIAQRWSPSEARAVESATLSPTFAATPAPRSELDRALWLVGGTLDEGQPASRREAMA